MEEDAGFVDLEANMAGPSSQEGVADLEGPTAVVVDSDYAGTRACFLYMSCGAKAVLACYSFMLSCWLHIEGVGSETRGNCLTSYWNGGLERLRRKT